MSARVTVAPRECDVCGCRTVEPDAEPYGTWTWRCNVCGSVEYEAPQATSPLQRGWVAYFISTRPQEADDWNQQYRLTPEKSLTWQTLNPQDLTSPGPRTPRPASSRR